MKLTEDEVKSLLVCGRCGGPAYSHTALSRGAGSEACELNVLESRAAAVEKILDARVHEALQPFRALFIAWEDKLPDVESSEPWVVQLSECVIDLGDLLVDRSVLPDALRWKPAEAEPVDLEDVDGDLAEIEEIAVTRAARRAEGVT